MLQELIPNDFQRTLDFIARLNDEHCFHDHCMDEQTKCITGQTKIRVGYDGLVN